MKATVIGSGYVDQVTESRLSEMANDVLCVDVDHSEPGALGNGDLLVHEYRSVELIHYNANAGCPSLGAGVPVTRVVRSNQYP